VDVSAARTSDATGLVRHRGPFTVELFTEASRRVWRRRDHVVFGVSPGNSYFQVARMAEILGWLTGEFDRIDVVVPDSALEHTFRALGYDPARAAQKARAETNVLVNRVKRAWASRGGPRPGDGLHRMSELADGAVYRATLAECERALAEDDLLRRTCADMSREVLRLRGHQGPVSDDQLAQAVRYLLAELPFFLASSAIFDAPTSLNFYHRALPLAELVFAGRSQLEPSPQQGYAVIRPATPPGSRAHTTGRNHVAQYNSLAKRLDDIESAIRFYRENVEFPSFLQALGDVAGRRVLDVGCGSGVYARLVARRGAGQVVGTDSSPEMIRLAEQAETAAPLGIAYQVRDVTTMPVLGEFDLVVAVNVLHYADSAAVLDAMCQRIAANLAPGGRLLTYVGNADVNAAAARDFGFVVDRPADLPEGAAFTVSIGTTPPVAVHVHHWRIETLVRALTSAGFARVEREPMTHRAVSAPQAARLDRLLRNPPGFLLSAQKPLAQPST
jgi:cyclo(L-tyrosyl-L-tyrosyl) synthase